MPLSNARAARRWRGAGEGEPAVRPHGCQGSCDLTAQTHGPQLPAFSRGTCFSRAGDSLLGHSQRLLHGPSPLSPGAEAAPTKVPEFCSARYTGVPP